ncbi:hypothetical protein EVAR_38590_1 [Eumeta japonica]|uniref:Uncharacterized protein n=1 Tax=Eumeta variegata TaxID=151549 RepID=A0A4C1WQF4_EUMVA|nr:hypothetical protein EVAR_38590_1 [Eumeta japonica]
MDRSPEAFHALLSEETWRTSATNNIWFSVFIGKRELIFFKTYSGGKLEGDLSKSKYSPAPIDTRNPRGVTSTLPVSCARTLVPHAGPARTGAVRDTYVTTTVNNSSSHKQDKLTNVTVTVQLVSVEHNWLKQLLDPNFDAPTSNNKYRCWPMY